MELFDSYLTRNVFETSVENVPPLIPLFKAFEKQKKKHLIKGFNASDFDESCQSYYEDSASMSGDFDQDFYARVEAGGRNRECLYDGREQDIKTFLKSHKNLLSKSSPLTTLSGLARGFQMPNEEKPTLRNLYGKALRELGYIPTLWDGSEHPLSIGNVKNFVYMPPGGFLMWHTNKRDNSQVTYRMYLLSVDLDGGSSFKYISKSDGKSFLNEVLVCVHRRRQTEPT